MHTSGTFKYSTVRNINDALYITIGILYEFVPTLQVSGCRDKAYRECQPLRESEGKSVINIQMYDVCNAFILEGGGEREKGTCIVQVMQNREGYDFDEKKMNTTTNL